MGVARVGNTEMSESENMDENDTYFDYTNLDGEVTALREFANSMYLYYIPVMICIGVTFNSVLCIVMLKTKMRKKFFTHVFVATSISDNGFLLTVLLMWTKDQEVDIYKAPGLCQMVIFMMHFFPFLSFWNSVSACIVLLIRPRSSCLTNTCNGPGKSRTLVISLSVFALTIYIYKTWTNGVIMIEGKRYCSTILPETESAMKILNILDVIVLLVLPFILFITFDLLIIVKQIMKMYLANSLNRSRTYRDALMIIIVHSICFHVFVGPGCISKLVLLFRYMSGNQNYEFRELFIENIFQYLFYTYFGIKPVFHVIVSKSLRVHLKELLMKAKQTMSMSRMLMNENSQDNTLL